VNDLKFIQQVLLTGIVATLALDVWQLTVSQVFGLPRSNWALVGRWVSFIPRGKFFHDAIGKTDPVRYEATIGWVAHYVVGLVYAAIYLGTLRYVLGWEPHLWTALGFGIVTVAAPWFLMQPGMGLGIMATKAPEPALVRAHSLSSHVAFGFGLYLGFLIFGWFETPLILR
jgi:Protein of unknown function (DUF2938)